MKDISTLVPDIYNLLEKTDGWFDAALADGLSADISRRLQGQLGADPRKPTLRLSKMGPVCPKALWFSIHQPEMGETPPPWVEVKFAFGHILEALVIALAKASGHDVQGEQDELELDGIVGHRDCVIDGCIVDVKSSATRSFQKFKDKTIKESDSFGYLDQLDGYVVASRNDPLVTNKRYGYLLAIDKQLGHMVTYKHEVTDERERKLRQRIDLYKRIVAQAEPPACECGTTPSGSSGNIQLDVKASYSAYKHCCFPHLRTFLYSSGPVYLTKVVRTPDVKELIA